MNRKASLTLCTLAAFALCMIAQDQTVSGDRGNIAVPGQASKDAAASAPVSLAQGRCFNGRCF